MGNKPFICAAIVADDPAALKAAGAEADLLELRLDRIGGGWRGLVKRLAKPWIACNRRPEEGGAWQGSEAARIDELREAVTMGAAIVDIELATPGLDEIVREMKGRAECIISHHDLKETPPPEEMREIINRQLEAGADICKLVATARSITDNINVLQLIGDFPDTRVVAFAMGELGHISRILCSLAGGYFTYASVEAGRESAPGQLTIRQMREIYGMLKSDG